MSLLGPITPSDKEAVVPAKPGVYRHPATGHTIEHFEAGNRRVAAGYEFLASAKDYEADPAKYAYVPDHLKPKAKDESKAKAAPPENKARSTTGPTKG